jgi:hypothetical protein
MLPCNAARCSCELMATPMVFGDVDDDDDGGDDDIVARVRAFGRFKQDRRAITNRKWVSITDGRCHGDEQESSEQENTNNDNDNDNSNSNNRRSVVIVTDAQRDRQTDTETGELVQVSLS